VAEEKRQETDTIAAARAALVDGNYKRAREIALRIASEGPSDARGPAQEIISATQTDRSLVIVGGLVLAVLAVLFFLVLTHSHSAGTPAP